MVKVAEFFGGIGAPRFGLEDLGIKHEVVNYVEIDKFAVKSYNAMYDENYEVQDISEWDKDIEVGFLIHGSPCQDISVAGNQKGGDKDSGTRSSLMWETVRIIEKTRPKFILWENVKNVLSKKHIYNFKQYRYELTQMGYVSHYEVLNAKDFGIPQNRERVFCLSIRKDIYNGFKFPEKEELKIRLKDILEIEVDEKYYLSKKMIDYVTSSGTKNFYYKPEIDLDIARPITASMVKMHRAGTDNYISEKFNKTGKRTNVCDITNNFNDNRIRKLTPKECWRLMGFKDKQFEKAEKVCSNSQLYKQAGNSIVVNVLKAIYKQMIKYGYLEVE